MSSCCCWSFSLSPSPFTPLLLLLLPLTLHSLNFMSLPLLSCGNVSVSHSLSLCRSVCLSLCILGCLLLAECARSFLSAADPPAPAVGASASSRYRSDRPLSLRLSSAVMSAVHDDSRDAQVARRKRRERERAVGAVRASEIHMCVCMCVCLSL